MVDSATPLGSRGREDVLSAGNLPVVGLPAVTTNVWHLRCHYLVFLIFLNLSPFQGLIIDEHVTGG